MKINNDNRSLIELSAYLKGLEEKSQKQTPQIKDEPEVVTDKVKISQKSKDISKVRKMLEDVPDVREEKVKGLKESIERGIYNVKGEAIADKLVKRSLIDIVL